MSGPRESRHPPAGESPVRSTGLSSPAERTGRPTRSNPNQPAAAGVPLSILQVQARLTGRDRTIIDWLDRHGVLTTAQLTAALFTSPITASHRLAKLRAIGVLDRFHRPFPAGGFGPWHWVIGPLGARIAAAGRDAKPPTPAAVRARHDRLTDSATLAHLLGANQFFIDLYAHTRRHPRSRLVRWWSEHETAQRYHRRIHPDGHALWRDHHRDTHGEGDNDIVVGLFLEYDRGTEQLRRLVAKLDAYDLLAGDGGPAYPVLFVLHSAQREAALHDEFARCRSDGPVPVATAVRSPQDPRSPSPAGAVWALVGQAGRRRRLAELPCDHGDPDNPLTTPNLQDRDLDREL
jgi:hypothetical protein